MANSKRDLRKNLLAEVLGVGAGQVEESALGSGQEKVETRKGLGRPVKEPTIPFTLRLRKEAAELLQQLVADLQARAIRGEFPRSEATIGTVVEQGLFLYAVMNGIKRTGFE